MNTLQLKYMALYFKGHIINKTNEGIIGVPKPTYSLSEILTHFFAVNSLTNLEPIFANLVPYILKDNLKDANCLVLLSYAPCIFSFGAYFCTKSHYLAFKPDSNILLLQFLFEQVAFLYVNKSKMKEMKAF